MNREKTIERLFAKRQITFEGCWLYTGYVGPNGYAQLSVDNKRICVHRLSLELFKPEHYNYQIALHIPACFNKHCFNPEHLYWGSYSDNMLDVVKVGRCWQRLRTHCPRGHEYTDDNVITRQSKGSISRFCKKCESERRRHTF